LRVSVIQDAVLAEVKLLVGSPKPDRL